jgi:hypothetical protein
MLERKNAYIQYLNAALNSTEEGDKVFYSTHGYLDVEIYNVLRTHIADRMVGKQMFASEDRLHADVLGPSAAIIVDQWTKSGMLPLLN